MASFEPSHVGFDNDQNLISHYKYSYTKMTSGENKRLDMCNVYDVCTDLF